MTQNKNERWYKNREIFKVTCTVCGERFDSYKPQGETERYCSDTCRGKKQYDKIRESNEQVTHKYVCQGCNSTFTTVVPRPEDKLCFCSMRCRQSYHSRNRRLNAKTKAQAGLK
jgi:hypothetical protein